jgi:hypothetical protein
MGYPASTNKQVPPLLHGKGSRTNLLRTMSRRKILYGFLGIGVVALSILIKFRPSLSGSDENVHVPPSLPDATQAQKKIHDEQDSRIVLSLLENAQSPEDIKLALKDLRPRQLHTLDYGSTFRSAVGSWYEQGPEFALMLISSLPREYRKTGFQWGEEFFLQKPSLFLSAADTSLTPSEAYSIRLKVFVALGKNDPETAIELIKQQGQGDSKMNSIGGAYASWSSHDMKSALLSVGDLPFPEDKDAAYCAILEKAKNQDADFIDVVDELEIPEEVQSQIVQAILRHNKNLKPLPSN